MVDPQDILVVEGILPVVETRPVVVQSLAVVDNLVVAQNLAVARSLVVVQNLVAADSRLVVGDCDNLQMEHQNIAVKGQHAVDMVEGNHADEC